MTKKKGSEGKALPSKTRLGNAKKILIGIGSLGLSGLSYSAQEDIPTVLPPPAGVTSQFSPRSRELIEDTLKALKVATGGKDDGRSIGQAIAAVKENRPEISLPVMCTAVLQLGLKEEAAQAAVVALSVNFSTSPSEVVSNLLAETYLNEGTVAARLMVEKLQKTLGPEVVQSALSDDNAQLGFATDAPASESLIQDNYGSYAEVSS